MRRCRLLVLAPALLFPVLAACGGSGGGGDGGSAAPPAGSFVHTAVTIDGAATPLSNPSLDGNASARLMVTHLLNSGPLSIVQNRHPIGVRYEASLGQWEIFNLDGAPMEPDASFFVTVLAVGDSSLHAATPGNVEGNVTRLSLPGADGDPGAKLFLTPYAGSIGSPDYTANPHHVGVYFGAGTWRIFNQDRDPMTLGARFFVVVREIARDTYTHRTTAASIGGPLDQGTYLDHPMLNDTPGAVLHVTAHWNPPGTPGTYNDHPIGVLYDFSVGRWAVVNADDGEMVENCSFNVWID
jgi:hypothetical protein